MKPIAVFTEKELNESNSNFRNMVRITGDIDAVDFVENQLQNYSRIVVDCESKLSRDSRDCLNHHVDWFANLTKDLEVGFTIERSLYDRVDFFVRKGGRLNHVGPYSEDSYAEPFALVKEADNISDLFNYMNIMDLFKELGNYTYCITYDERTDDETGSVSYATVNGWLKTLSTEDYRLGGPVKLYVNIDETAEYLAEHVEGSDIGLLASISTNPLD